ncbi:hypothetical protein AB1M95_14105 [Sulfitobacter sp. LCG007]
MEKTRQNPIIAAAASGEAIDLGEKAPTEMSDETAARLRALCEQTGEPFDTALTEDQALERIEALEEKS